MCKQFVDVLHHAKACLTFRIGCTECSNNMMYVVLLMKISKDEVPTRMRVSLEPFRNAAPFSFTVISTPCSDLKVVCFQWVEAILPCKENTSSWRIHSHLMVALHQPISGWSKANVICCHIFSSFDINWFVPGQGQRRSVSVQG